MAVRTDADGKPAIDVARRVRSCQTQAGMTQEELARAAKVTPKFLSQLENGHLNASIAVLGRVVEDGLSMPLATFFGADPDDDVVAEVATIVALLAGQPEPVRRCASRLIRALIENDSRPNVSVRSRRPTGQER
jgi:transcriptional regulator with XRE-family HTH domain